MLINPMEAIKNGWIKFPTTVTPEFIAKCIQPNAIDFTLDKLYTISHRKVFVISETEKVMRGGKQIFPEMDPISKHEYWTIDANSVYDGMSSFYVDVPPGIATKLIIRSTFNRNGIFLTSGLYDTGYSGNIGFALHNRSGIAKIAQGTRIGQIEFYKSDSEGTYAGGYNTENGEHWSKTI